MGRKKQKFGMVISFFGHSDFSSSIIDKKNVVNILENIIKNDKAEFYLGGYGGFDSFARECCELYCERHRGAKKIFVSAYLGKFLESRKAFLKSVYDEVVYPPIESLPPRFAILKRNEWMIMNSDLVIVYVERTFGGANTALEFEKRKKKNVINLYTLFAK